MNTAINTPSKAATATLWLAGYEVVEVSRVISVANVRRDYTVSHS